MSFLQCNPTVFVIGNEYEIFIHAKNKGIFSVCINGKSYYAQNSGVLPSEKKIAKIRIPQNELNSAKTYEIVFRAAINRRGYFSQFEQPQVQRFTFKPLEKTEDIHVYHIADVHGGFEKAKKTALYFGDDTDLFIFNGDIGEANYEDSYFEICKFIGDISKGSVPVVYTRGNHDARGKFAECYEEYFPVNGHDTFYTFELGVLQGVALDCGEDKRDDHTDEKFDIPEVYGDVNIFHDYRQRELQWLKNTTFSSEHKITFAISHISPVLASLRAGWGCDDIERDCYGQWNNELERLGVQFMLSGHFHNAFIVYPDDERNIIPHTYPIVFGSKLSGVKYAGGLMSVEKFYGAAITINKDKIKVVFTDQNHEELEEHVINI